MSTGEPNSHKPGTPRDDNAGVNEDPDVLLDVPVLKIEELDLELKDLRAHVSLRADLANLVNVNVGVDAYLDEVKLNLKGVDAQALLKVRLDRVLDTFDRALATIDNNPEILGDLLGAARADESGDNGNLPPDATLLGEATDDAGRAVLRSVDGAGNLMETTLDDSGVVADEKITGTLRDLPTEEEYVDDDGMVVSRARDDAGNIVESKLDDEGNVVGVSVPEFAGEDQSVEINATTAAEKKARKLDVDLSSVTGSGNEGRILVGDVEKAARYQS